MLEGPPGAVDEAETVAIAVPQLVVIELGPPQLSAAPQDVRARDVLLSSKTREVVWGQEEGGWGKRKCYASFPVCLNTITTTTTTPFDNEDTLQRGRECVQCQKGTP